MQGYATVVARACLLSSTQLTQQHVRAIEYLVEVTDSMFDLDYISGYGVPDVSNSQFTKQTSSDQPT